MKSTIHMVGLSDQGRVRDKNEDAFFVDVGLGLMIVSDGMGGQQSGEMASRIVIEALPKHLVAGRVAGTWTTSGEVAELLAQSISIAGEIIYEKSRESEELDGMGATVVVGILVEESFVLGNLGDSRAYLLRGGTLERLTHDHTLAKLLLDLGAISKDTCRDHPTQHMLRRFVGMRNCPPADVGILDLHAGDRILLCSDGLTGMLDDSTIGKVLLYEQDAEVACQQLIDMANQAGGTDNITVTVADLPHGDKEDARREKEVSVRRTVGRSLRRPGKALEAVDVDETTSLGWMNEGL